MYMQFNFPHEILFSNYQSDSEQMLMGNESSQTLSLILFRTENFVNCGCIFLEKGTKCTLE